MDFFLFSQKSKPQNSLTDLSPQNSPTNTHSSKQLYDTSKKVDNHTSFDNLKNGEYVRIIRKENSPLNYYKGYIGEIKNYKRGQSRVQIVLQAQNNAHPIIFPIDHFVKME